MAESRNGKAVKKCTISGVGPKPFPQKSSKIKTRLKRTSGSTAISCFVGIPFSGYSYIKHKLAKHQIKTSAVWWKIYNVALTVKQNTVESQY